MKGLVCEGNVSQSRSYKGKAGEGQISAALEAMSKDFGSACDGDGS